MKSDNFELFTTAGERKGRDALRYFEQVRTFFVQSTPRRLAATLPVRIVAFNSEKEYAPYKPGEAADAYFVGGHDREYIVLRSIAPEYYPVVVHEYVHLIVKSAGLDLPPCLNEGLAELYSTLRPVGNQLQVGMADPGRVHTLRTERWLPLGTLFAVDHDSPYYNEKNRAGLFYAQSWALVHMLHFDPAYRANFNNVFSAAASKQEAGAIFQKYLNKSLPEVEKNLAAYMAQDRIYVMNLNLKLEKRAEAPEVSEVTPEELKLVQAQVLMRIDRKEPARQLLASIGESKDPEVAETRAYLDAEGPDFARHLARAAELGSKNPRVYYDLAFDSSAGERRSELLRKVLALNPDFPDIRYSLVSSLMREEKYQAVLQELLDIKPVKPERAYEYFYTWAYAACRMKSPQAAEDAIRRARTWAKTDGEKRRLDELASVAEYLKSGGRVEPLPQGAMAVRPRRAPSASSSDEPPVMRRREREEMRVTEIAPPQAAEPREKLTGQFVRLDCLQPAARVKLVDAQGQSLYLMIDDPHKVEIVGKNGGSIEMSCGEQKPVRRVSVEFVPAADTRLLSAGLLRKLRFE